MRFTYIPIIMMAIAIKFSQRDILGVGSWELRVGSGELGVGSWEWGVESGELGVRRKRLIVNC
jgi:hypothetical protein